MKNKLLTSQAEIHCQRAEFWSQITAAGVTSTAGISCVNTPPPKKKNLPYLVVYLSLADLPHPCQFCVNIFFFFFLMTDFICNFRFS